MRRLRLALMALALGCSTATTGGTPDGDPGGGGPDAAVAATPPTEAREIVSGGKRLTGGGFTADVQVGHGVSQEQMSGGGFTAEGAAVVKR